MQRNNGVRAARTRGVWLLFVTAAVLAIAFAMWWSARKAGSMMAAATPDETQLAQVTPGTKTKIVIEVTEATADGTLRGKLLQKKTETTYVRTTSPATVRTSAGTKLVMGKQSDVHAGAVVHVTGTVAKDHGIEAEQIVILTGYVQVQ